MVTRASMMQIRSDLTSPLTGVSNLAWARFADALTIDDDDGPNNGKPRPFNAVTHACGLGCFGISPRRLVDIGAARAVHLIRGKPIAVGFIPRDFLTNPLAQRDALAISMKRYNVGIAGLRIDKIALPPEMSRSGVLALYHRLGPNALAKWQKHKQQSTLALFQRANGLF